MYKTDGTHAEIKQALRDAGVEFLDKAACAGLGCDFIARHAKTGQPVFLEAKTWEKRTRLTDSERALRALFPESFYVPTDAEEALVACGVKVGTA